MSQIRYSRNEEIHEIITDLPMPDDYFSGSNGWFSSPPRNILVFNRKTAREAMAGGLHLHPRFVFCWCVEGDGGIMVDGSMLRLEEGQSLLLFPFQQHYFSSFQSESILWLFVTFELEEHHFLDPLRSSPVKIDGALTEQLKNVVKAFQANHARNMAEGGAISMQLALLLGKLVSRLGKEVRTEGQQQSGCARVMDQRISLVVRHIYENLNHSLRVDQVAKFVHTSPSHLRRLFRHEMEISLGRFMLQARLNHAFSLLHTTDYSLAWIAEDCGFSSVYSFSRAFRKEKGMTPGAVRRDGMS